MNIDLVPSDINMLFSMADHQTGSMLSVTINRKDATVPYDMTDIIIQDVGRFCERFQSDMLSMLYSIHQFLNTKTIKQEHVFGFGIRSLGVDSNTEIAHKIIHADNGCMSFANMYYSRIYAIIVKPYDEEIIIELKDIKQTLSSICSDIRLYGKDTILSTKEKEND